MNIKNCKPDKVSLAISTCIKVGNVELMYMILEIRTYKQ